MNILVVTQYFWPENFRINELVEEMVKREHEVVVLTGAPNYPEGTVFPEFKKKPDSFAHFKGAEIVRIPILPRGSGSIRLIFNYFSFVISACLFGGIKLRHRVFDAIFVFEPSPVTVAIPAILQRKLKKTPLAFWILDLWPDTLGAIGVIKEGFTLRIVNKLVRWIYRHCDLILVQSKGFVDPIKKQGVDQKTIKFFPNWVEETYNKTPEDRAIEIEYKPDCFNIVFAGNVGEAQDFPAIIEAIEKLRKREEIRWIIIGDGRMLGWVKEEIKKRGLEKQVLIAGRFPADRMMSFFRHADALIVSLKSEPIFSQTIPGKVQSYLAAGIPILAMLDGEGARVIRESKSGFVSAAGDSSGFAESVIRLMNCTKQERQILGDQGRDYSVREFNKKRLMDHLENWLSDVSKKS